MIWFKFERKLWRLVRATLVLLLVFLATSWLTSTVQGTFVVKVTPWEAGVRQDNFGGGLLREDLRAGDHYELPGFTAIQAVDMRGRLAAFGTHLKLDSPLGRPRPALDIRTKGNQSAQVSLLVAWHIAEGQAHELVAGAQLSTLDSKVADKLEELMLPRLAALDSEEWFDTTRRAAMAAELEALFEPALAPLAVVVDGVYIESVRFSDDYESKLQEQQVSYQLGLLHEVTGRVEEAKQSIQSLENETAAQEAKLIAEWEQRRAQARGAFDLELAELQATTQTYVKTLKSQTESEFAQTIAAGERAVAEASAFAERRRLELLGSPGGRVWLAMRAADQLRFGEIWLDSRDPRVPSMLDLDAVVDMLEGQPLPPEPVE